MTGPEKPGAGAVRRRGPCAMSAATCALRFRCVDGVDVGPTEYPLTLSVAKLKAQLAEDVEGNGAQRAAAPLAPA